MYHGLERAESREPHVQKAGIRRRLAQVADISALRMHAESATAFIEDFHRASLPLAVPLAPSRLSPLSSAVPYPSLGSVSLLARNIHSNQTALNWKDPSDAKKHSVVSAVAVQCVRHAACTQVLPSAGALASSIARAVFGRSNTTAVMTVRGKGLESCKAALLVLPRAPSVPILVRILPTMSLPLYAFISTSNLASAACRSPGALRMHHAGLAVRPQPPNLQYLLSYWRAMKSPWSSQTTFCCLFRYIILTFMPQLLRKQDVAVDAEASRLTIVPQLGYGHNLKDMRCGSCRAGPWSSCQGRLVAWLTM